MNNFVSLTKIFWPKVKINWNEAKGHIYVFIKIETFRLTINHKKNSISVSTYSLDKLRIKLFNMNPCLYRKMKYDQKFNNSHVTSSSENRSRGFATSRA